MYRGMFGCFALFLAVAFAPSAKAAGIPDRLLVTAIGSGNVVFDQTLDAEATGNARLTFGGPLPALNLPGVIAVAILEAEASGGSTILLPGTAQAVSDLVVFSAASAVLPLTVSMISHADAGFSALVGSLAGLTVATVAEAHALTDLTALLQSDLAAGLRVQVQSGIVPEPSTALLLGAGLLGLAAQGRRARALA